ncbi:hypothetical protein [Halorussus caseinilyticus]
MAGVLRLALVFVLLTFVMIAVVAGMMFTKIPTETASTDRTTGETGDYEGGQTVDDEGVGDDSEEGTPECDEPKKTTTESDGPEAGSEQTDEADGGSDSTIGDGSEQL